MIGLPAGDAHADVLAIACIVCIAGFAWARVAGATPIVEATCELIPYDTEWTLIEAHFFGDPGRALSAAERFVRALIQRAGVADTAVLEDFAKARVLGVRALHGLATAEELARAMRLHRTVVKRLSRRIAA